MCLENGTPEIARQRRAELRHAWRQTAIVARQLGKLVGGGLVLGIVEFRSRLLFAAASIERLIANAGFDAVKAGGLNDAIRIEVFGDLHQFGGLNGNVVEAEQARAAVGLAA